jgi:hypothetical protein
VTIKAIETSYKGYRFRSRLEARWAVFFDALDIEFQYEPEGFEKDGQRYLPDFYIPQSKVWVEVKGSDELLRHDVPRLTAVLDWESPLPGMSDSAFSGEGGLLLLGEVPWISGFGIVIHPIVKHHQGLRLDWAYFAGRRLWRAGDFVHPPWDDLLGFPEIEYGIENDPQRWTTKTRFIDTKRAYAAVLEAYKGARSARFEHGQYGAAA